MSQFYLVSSKKLALILTDVDVNRHTLIGLILEVMFSMNDSNIGEWVCRYLKLTSKHGDVDPLQIKMLTDDLRQVYDECSPIVDIVKGKPTSIEIIYPDTLAVKKHEKVLLEEKLCNENFIRCNY